MGGGELVVHLGGGGRGEEGGEEGGEKGNRWMGRGEVRGNGHMR